MKYVSYFHISTSHSKCAVPNMAVVCNSLISCFPFMLLMYCLSDFEMVPVAPNYYWYHFCFHIPHTLNFDCEGRIIFSFSFLVTFLSPEISCIFLFHYHWSWFPLRCQKWFCRFALVFHNMVTLPSWLVLPILLFVHPSVQCLILSPFPFMLNCSWAQTVSCLFMYCSFASIEHTGVMWFTVCWHSSDSLNFLNFLFF